MFARSLLYLLGIVSLIWIVYVSIELTSNESKYNPVYLFSKEDGTVIISNELSNLETLLQLHPTTAENTAILHKLSLDQKFRIYISKKRNQLLFESKDIITKKSLVVLFGNENSLVFTGKNSF